MADEELGYPVEIIPDSDSVFMRAHRNHVRDGEFGPGVFRAHAGGMSVDWDKYSSADATRERGKQSRENYAVIQMGVRGIRAIKGLDVKHSPEANNRAHSNVDLPEGREDVTEVRLHLGRLAEIVIPLKS